MKKEMDILWQNAADIIVLDAPVGSAPTLGGDYAAGGTDAPIAGDGGGYKPAKLVPGGGN